MIKSDMTFYLRSNIENKVTASGVCYAAISACILWIEFFNNFI